MRYFRAISGVLTTSVDLMGHRRFLSVGEPMVLELGARLEEPKQDADKIKEIRKLGGELLDLKDQDGLIPLYRCSTSLPIQLS